MSVKSFVITFLWVILGVLLIFTAVFFSTSGSNYLVKNSSLVLMILLGLLLFIFLPVYSVLRVIKDWNIKPKTRQEIYFRKANNGIGLFMLTNVLIGFYMSANLNKVVDLSILKDGIAITGSFISSSFLLWGSYYLAKSKGQSGWHAVLSYFYPFGLIYLLFLPNKYKK